MSQASFPSILLAILAAGQSNRFGEQDKLAARLGGKMLGLHVADNLASQSRGNSVIIAPANDHPCRNSWRDSGYDILVNEKACKGQSTSVSLAAQHASSLGADALCICLADMPFISTEHIDQLLAKFEALESINIVASSDGENTMPPAIFPASQFSALINLDGDKGARSLLSEAVEVTFDKSNMLDIDTPNDLMIAESIL